MVTISFSDSELATMRGVLLERIVDIGVTITDCGLASFKDNECLYAHFKHERNELSLLYNKFCSHE